MSTQFAPTPVDSLAPDPDKTTRAQVSLTDWADYHDVFGWLLPMENRVQNPLDTARKVQTTLDELNDLSEVLTRKDLNLQNNGDGVTQRILRLFEITVFDEGRRPVRYRNPNYRHYDERTQPVETTAERKEHWEKWKMIPTIRSPFFMHHWGVTRSGIAKWVGRNNDKALAEQLTENRRRMGRTLATHKRWTGMSIREISEPLPVCYNTAKRWVTKHATTTDWRPPERPCRKRWFMASP